MPGFSVISQTDFSGGMWTTATPERIPANGVASAVNVLVDDTGGLYRRGGTFTYAGTGWPSSLNLIRWVWQGTLTAGARTLFATTTNLYSINGSTITNLGAYTGMPAGANRPAVLGGKMFLPGGNVTYDGTTVGTGFFNQVHFASVANRLVSASNNTVFFSKVGDPATWTSTDFWLIPGGATILGLAPLRDSLIVFTDQGVWVISNMALNLTDAVGNVQQRLDLYSPDLVLWGTNAGVAGYQGGLVVPAREGVWLMRLGVASEKTPAFELLSDPISTLYRGYVAVGYQPGQATVYRGHYFLPILNSGTPVDLLVCRLDLPSKPWTSITGFGAAISLTTAADGKTMFGGMDTPGVGSSKLATLDYLSGLGTDGALGQPQMSVTTRDYLTGSLTQNTIVKARFGYRSTGTGVVTVTFGRSGDGTTRPYTLPFTLGTLPGNSGVLSTTTLPVGKTTRAGRFALDGAPTTRLQSVEVFVRQQGRQ